MNEMNKIRNISQQDANVYMYGSWLLLNNPLDYSVEERSLFLTLNVSNMNYPAQLKDKVYEKMKSVISSYGVDDDIKNFSMVIAGDAEGSRSGTVDRRTATKPAQPHYHAIIAFTPDVWAVVNENFEELKVAFCLELSLLREVNFAREDVGKDFIPKDFWLKKYIPKTNSRKYNFPLADGLSYVIKANIHANRHQVMAYQPSAYPYEIDSSDQAKSIAERSFKIILDHDQLIKSSRATKTSRVTDAIGNCYKKGGEH